MHDSNTLFLKEMNQLLTSHNLRANNPDAMIMAVFIQYGAQTAFEFGSLVYTVLKEFHHDGDAHVWQEVSQRFLSSHSNEIVK
jgi:hypothetical protein